MTEPARSGLLITLEGVEGCGKTTQLRLLHARLEAKGFRAVESTTSIGAQIRQIMLDPHNREMTATTELMLMVAAQAQAAAEIIVPALERGEIVLSDRFTDSTLAYQGEARGLGFDMVRDAQRLALGSLIPDLTICVMIDIETGLRRAARRNQDASEARIDEEPLEFHQRVEKGYRKIAALEPDRFRMIDGTGEPAQVAERVWAEVSRVLADNKD
ncbi:MAG TPA: dTMP kinase [Bryobacteraceae bacterium]|nr:dTMP kinase [Bryobacteraceae bacterium]